MPLSRSVLQTAVDRAVSEVQQMLVVWEDDLPRFGRAGIYRDSQLAEDVYGSGKEPTEIVHGPQSIIR